MTAARPVSFRDVINPRIPRPAAGDSRRDDYDRYLRVIVHLTMITCGILAAGVMTGLSVNIYMMLCVQGVIPGAVQELGDFLIRL